MFLDILFPIEISYGATGGARFRTEMASLPNGVEKRNITRTRGLGEWDVTQGIRDQADMEDLIEFFHNTYGAAYSFRYRDWSDYTATSSQGLFDAIDATNFQMKKRYTVGANTYDRKIQLPENGTITVTGGTVSSINYATGIVTMSSGTPTSWEGNFHCKCRFTTDEQDVNIQDFSIYNWSLSLKEVID